MNALEMHIEINQQLQLVSANRTRKFLTPEIDWVLNKIQERFIRQCLNPIVTANRQTNKYTIDEFKIDALKNLVVSGISLTAYQDISGFNRSRSVLPWDYSYLLSDASVLENTCKRVDTLSEVTETVQVTVLKLSQTAKVSAPYYLTSSITVDAVTIQIPQDLDIPNQFTGFNQIE